MRQITKTLLLACLAILPLAIIVSNHKKVKPSYDKPQKEDRIDLAIALEHELTKDLELGYVPKMRLHDANTITQSMKQVNIHRTNELTWTEHGPSNVGGRTRTIIFDESDSTHNTVFAGNVAGGVWKGTDIFTQSPTWTNLTPDQSNLAIGSLAQDPKNPSVIYAGTGEGWFNGDAIRGVGIFKSIDSGQTWSLLPSTRSSNFRYIQKLMFDGNGHLLACTRNAGVMKSEDDGGSWNTILGSNIGAFSDRAADIEMSIDGTLYATLGIYSSDGLYRSDDNGVSWNFIHQNGMPNQNFRRVEVAVAPNDSHTVYAILETPSGNCEGIYRSVDKGENWTSLPIPESEQGLIFGRNQLWYDLTMAVDPNDPLHVIIGGVNLFRSLDGGDSWQQLTNWFNTSSHPYVHADQHNILFDDRSAGRILFGNDGGIWVSENILVGNPQFNHAVDNYNVTQFYSCDIHPTIPGLIGGGSQDNGTQIVEADKSDEAFKISGGDGGFAHFGDSDPSYFISSFTGNNYSFYRDFAYLGGAEFDGGSFINPTTVSGDYFYGHFEDGQFFRIKYTEDFIEDLVFVYEFDYQTIRHISPSPNVADRLYFGFNDGRVAYVDDVNNGNLKNGTEIFNRSGNISCVAIEPGNEDHIIVTVSNYGETHVWETKNGGGTWFNASNNLPDIPVRWAIFAPGRFKEVLLATETGVWRTDSIAGAWTVWQPEPMFPSVRTDMLKIQENTGIVLAGTHGRGFFMTDYYAQYVGNKNKLLSKIDAYIYPNPSAEFLQLNSRQPISGNYFIHSIDGKEVMTGEIKTSSPINIKVLPFGTYIFLVYDGETYFSEKFVKY